MTISELSYAIKVERIQDYLKMVGIDELKTMETPNCFGLRFVARKNDTWASYTVSETMLMDLNIKDSSYIAKLIIDELVKTFNSPSNPDWVLSKIMGEA